MSFYKEPTKFRNFTFSKEQNNRKEPTKFRNYIFSKEPKKNRKEPTKFRDLNILQEQTRKEPTKFRNFNNKLDQNNRKESIKFITNINLNKFINNQIDTNLDNNLFFDDDNNNYVIGNIIYKIDNYNNKDYLFYEQFCNNRNLDIDKQNNIENINNNVDNQLMKDLDNLWLETTIDLDFWNEICTEYLTKNYFYKDFLELVTINKYSKKFLKSELIYLENIQCNKKKKKYNVLKKKIISFHLKN